MSSAQSADYVRRSEVMETLLEAFDAIALAENYHQPEHVWMALRKAKGRIVDAIQGLQIDGDVSDAAL